MKSFQENMNEYRKQLEKGTIQKAYQGLMEYMMGLKIYFKKKYLDFGDLDGLTKKIEMGILKFIQDVENFIIKH